MAQTDERELTELQEMESSLYRIIGWLSRKKLTIELIGATDIMTALQDAQQECATAVRKSP